MQAVFYHKASKTLLVTDAVVYISSDPPEVRFPACYFPACCSRMFHTGVKRQLIASPVCSRLQGFPAREMHLVMAGCCLLYWACCAYVAGFTDWSCGNLQVINRAKLERAGKDNLFVKTLYGKDKPMIPQSIEEQQRIGALHH